LESIPPGHAAKVIYALLSEFELMTGLTPGSIEPIETKAQLWGAAVPMNVMVTGEGREHGYIWDHERKVGVCGDWLSSPSIEGAVTSGIQLADAITAARLSANLTMKPKFRAVP